MTTRNLEIEPLVRAALDEDIGSGDVTTLAIVDPAARCRAFVVAKQHGVLSGIDVFRAVFELLEAEIDEWSAHENGSKFKRGQHVASFVARTASVLTGERVALNLLQRLSGVATHTAEFVARVSDLNTRICDTRKTTPLLRQLEKRAVVHGGGANHRFGLYDGVLVKENHIAAAGGIRHAVELARNYKHHLMQIEVEVRTLQDVREALDAKANVILLDNMPPEDMREAVELGHGQGVEFEASGNVTLSNVHKIASTGVDYVSVGALTHSSPAVDLSLLIANV